jgi:hypothetical protein
MAPCREVAAAGRGRRSCWNAILNRRARQFRQHAAPLRSLSARWSAFIDDAVIVNGHIDVRACKLLRDWAMDYCAVNELFAIRRPTVPDPDA